MSNLLELKNISKIYGDLHALDNINLSIEKGEWVAIMGPSGSGKSTLIKCLTGVHHKDAGTIILDDMAVDANWDHILTLSTGITDRPNNRLLIVAVER